MAWSHRRRHHLAIVAFGLAAAFAGAQLAPACAEEAGSFLKGQTVRFIVGYSPGGGYDSYARMLAPHFEKRTGATVVVENRPGGGGLTALNQLIRNKPDGLSMMMLNGEGALMAQLTKQPGVAFDMAKVSVLGRVAHEQHFLIVRPELPDSLKDIIASGNKIKFSATGRVDNLGDYAAVTCEALQMNCEIITGYKGSKEAGLAVMNREVDALAISDGSGFHYAQGGRAKIVATIGFERSEYKSDVPTLYELFQISPDRKWVLDFRLTVKAFGRAMVAPPDLPADKLQYLRRVWREVLTDPQVIAEGSKTERFVSYQEPAKLEKTAHEILGALSPEKLKEIQEVILKKFSS